VEGIKSLQNGDYCGLCDAKVNAILYNFCPKCGNPLNGDAIKLKEQQNKKIKIELLDELAQNITDENTLKTIMNKLKEL